MLMQIIGILQCETKQTIFIIIITYFADCSIVLRAVVSQFVTFESYEQLHMADSKLIWGYFSHVNGNIGNT
jgi:hypothetical protein